jgi:hypothetical protein
MSSNHVLRFDSRRSVAVWLTRVERPPGWLVLAGDHGFLHGNHAAAVADAEWLSQNLGFVVRQAGASNHNRHFESSPS